ncbi:hypothetical protein HDU76_009777 [Blyttiomyces sp. JEL0837]|nr:hypothetical protein HDU76_009777 [Blyttiomyces sp. JEL0837]
MAPPSLSDHASTTNDNYASENSFFIPLCLRGEQSDPHQHRKNHDPLAEYALELALHTRYQPKPLNLLSYSNTVTSSSSSASTTAPSSPQLLASSQEPPRTASLPSPPQQQQTHPLLLGDTLELIFIILQNQRSLHPCLFVCREWNVHATHIMWRSVSLDSMERFMTFSSSFIDFTSLADRARHHLLRRAATLKDRGWGMLIKSVYGDVGDVLGTVIKKMYKETATTTTTTTTSSLESQGSTDSTTTTKTAAPPLFDLRKMDSSGLFSPRPGPFAHLPWPIRIAARLSLSTLLTVLSGASGNGKLLMKKQSPSPPAPESTPTTPQNQLQHFRNPSPSSYKLLQLLQYLHQESTSLKRLIHQSPDINTIWHRPYLPSFTCTKGPTITIFHLHRLTTLTDSLLSPVLRSCPSLHHLELYACEKITDQPIIIAIRSCPYLRHLITPGCLQLTNSMALAIQRYMNPSVLETWDVRSCPLISDYGIDIVASHCEMLSLVNLGRTTRFLISIN